jgi:hypothetical protein
VRSAGLHSRRCRDLPGFTDSKTDSKAPHASDARKVPQAAYSPFLSIKPRQMLSDVKL